jgi:hypothetical protein
MGAGCQGEWPSSISTAHRSASGVRLAAVASRAGQRSRRTVRPMTVRSGALRRAVSARERASPSPTRRRSPTPPPAQSALWRPLRSGGHRACADVRHRTQPSTRRRRVVPLRTDRRQRAAFGRRAECGLGRSATGDDCGAGREHGDGGRPQRRRPGAVLPPCSPEIEDGRPGNRQVAVAAGNAVRNMCETLGPQPPDRSI